MFILNKIIQYNFIIIILFASLSEQFNKYEFNDYKNHPCIRQCNHFTSSMECYYEWTIEWYEVLSKACLTCPFNESNCYNNECISADGFLRPVITINRMIPGPSIIACKGDTINIILFNNLHTFEGTSIHWHGLLQKNTPYMDGVSLITQCPVLSHSYFQYKFKVNDVGTHLWHSHSGLQRADGTFGPIVVHEYDNENIILNEYDFDLPEHIITLNDWTHKSAISKFSSHHHSEGDNRPDTILINGKGVFHNYYDEVNNKTVLTPRAIFYVEQGKRYRFRLINAGFLYCPIEFSIDKHNLTVISTDGNLVEPYEVESLVIYAGERFDFILHTNKIVNNYWIRAKGLADCSFKIAIQTAILNYKNKSLDNLKSIHNTQIFTYQNISRSGLQLNPWNLIINKTNSDIFTSVDELRSIITDDNFDFYKKITNEKLLLKKYYLQMDFNQINNEEFYDQQTYSLKMIKELYRRPLYTPQINNISLLMPSTPLLYKWHTVPKELICDHFNKTNACYKNKNKNNNTNEYCTCFYVLEFSLGDVVEFVITDSAFTFQSNHPMHLHGFKFAVLGVERVNRSIDLETIKKMDDNGLLKRNLNKPPIKDTVTVPAGGYTIIRFIADNPGTWLFHCHLDFHSEIGMALIVKVGEVDDLPPEPIGWPHCGNFFLND